MGRHSIPDPDDSAGEEQHEEPQTQRFGQSDDPEADSEPGYRSEDFGDSDDENSAPGAFSFDDPDYRQVEFEDLEPAGSFDLQRVGSSTPPQPSRPRSGPAHGGEWDGGEWTGSHRAVTAGRRGVSISVIVALVAVVVVVGAVIGWRFFGDALSNRSDTAAARCVNGELTVAVVADPSVSGQIQTLADNYNRDAAPVGDRCVKVGVTPAESDQVVNGFIGQWPGELGEQPALWIPASSVSAARLEASAGEKTISDSRSLVTSPVVLAVRPDLKAALGQQNWGTLPSLQTNPSALDGLGLTGWGSLRLALPLSGDSDASYLAAEAVAAEAAPPGAPPSSGIGAVNSLVAGQPKLADKTASTAMDALLNATDPAGAPVHAVVTTEQQLFQRAAKLDDAKNAVASWLPPAPVALADYPTALLAGEWLSQEQVSAASEFARFMRKPEQLAELAKAGFRTEGGAPPQSDVTDFAPLAAPLSVGDNAMRVSLANTLTAPVASPAVTIMLDQSMPVDEGGRTRLANVAAALNARLQSLPPNSAVGLWTFDGVEGRSEVTMGPLSDQVDGRPRSAALTGELDGQSASSGGAVSFTTLRLVYNQAKENFREGQSNSVLVITTGPHTDQSLNGAGLEQFIRGAVDPARRVKVNVIDFGSDSDRATWEAVAEISGGGYQNLANSTGPELTSAVADFLG
ncbi:substrate-binding domain-containing protein [Mycolicibacterium tusciae]|uniref:substrate-binding domain-containing protein n=1 Tax=Mycolicibacterium tusciae TaxID=75922 RepID=UPI00024A1A6B|nr:substrate-binding domain-containing protein [Mycolicibacterium tusciae]